MALNIDGDGHEPAPPKKQSRWDRLDTPGRVLASFAAVGTFLILVGGLLNRGEPPPSASLAPATEALSSLTAPRSAATTALPTPSAEPTPTPSAEPTPTPAPTTTPITGTVDLTGNVASRLPGTLVASGAEVTSLLDGATRPVDYYAIQVNLGDTLEISVMVPDNYCHIGGIYFAYPGGGYDDSDWMEIYLDWDSNSGSGSTVVSVSGAYSLEVRACSAAPAFPYTISFAVR